VIWRQEANPDGEFRGPAGRHQRLHEDDDLAARKRKTP